MPVFISGNQLVSPNLAVYAICNGNHGQRHHNPLIFQFRIHVAANQRHNIQHFCQRKLGAKEMWEQFEMGFWHPFGAYTGLSSAEVLDWKSGEVVRHGWTLWSFVHSSTAAAWLKHLSDAKGPVYAFCSHSPAARDPDINKGTLLASHFRYLGESEWQPMPNPNIIKVTNPFKRNGLALGFKVSRVIPIEPAVPPFSVEWYSRGEDTWRTDRVPTRGEYLIRRGGSTPLRRVCAVLELATPYLAELRHESAISA